MDIQPYFCSPVAIRLGWMLLHSIWQLALVAAAVAAVFYLGRLSARVRYGIACLGMAAMVACPVATFVWVPAPEVREPDVETGFAVVPEATSVETEPGRRALTPEIPETNAESASGTPAIAISPAATGPVESPPTFRERLATAAPWFVPPWLAGMLFLALWQLGGYYCSRRWLVLAEPIELGGLPEKMNVLAERMGVNRTVRLLQSTRVATPLVLGWLRPAILLPVELITNLPAEHWDAVLAHELAHIRRYDYLVNLLQTAAETVLFYHPGVWMVSRWIRIERELCCDDVAADICGSPIQYAEALTRLEVHRREFSVTQPHPAVAAVDGVSTLHRVRRLLGVSPKPKHGATRLAGVFAAALVLAAVIAFTGASADDEKPAEEKAAVPTTEPAEPAPPVPAETPLPTMDEIAKVWKARQKRLRSARIEWEVTTFIPKHSWPPALSLLEEGKVTNEEFEKLDPLPPDNLLLKMKRTALLDGNMHARTRDGTIWDPDQGKPKRVVCRTTFDGKDTKSLFSDDPELPVGFINMKTPKFDQPPMPLNFYFRPCGPRGDGDDLKNYRLVAGNERETIDGRECIVVERMPPGPPYEGEIRTFWLDPQRDFIPVRTRGWNGRNVNISYRKDAAHGWVPSGWHWTYPEGKKFFERVTAKITRCEINVEIPKSKFEQEFPVGSGVCGYQNGEYYNWILWPNKELRVIPKRRKWKDGERRAYVLRESAKAREAEAQIKKGNQP